MSGAHVIPLPSLLGEPTGSLQQKEYIRKREHHVRSLAAAWAQVSEAEAAGIDAEWGFA